MTSKAQFKVISQDDYARRVRLAKMRPPHARTTAGCLLCKEKKVKVGLVSHIKNNHSPNQVR